MTIECPICKSRNFKSLQMVHAGGLSSGAGIGVGVTGNGIGVGVAVTRSQTALSKKAAPPKMQPGQKYGLIVLGVFSLILALLVVLISGFNGLFLIFFAGGVVSIAWSQTDFIANWDREASAQKQAWSETYMCEDCGNKYLPR